MPSGQILASHGTSSIALLARQDRRWSRAWGEVSRVGTIDLEDSRTPFSEQCLAAIEINRGFGTLKVTLQDEIGHYFSFPLISQTRTWKEMVRIAEAQFVARFDFDPYQYQIAVDVSQDNQCICFAAPKAVIQGWQQVAQLSRLRFEGCAPHFARRLNEIRNTLTVSQWVAVLGDRSLALGRIGTRGLRGVRVHRLRLAEGAIESCLSRDQLLYPAPASETKHSANIVRVIGTATQLEQIPTAMGDVEVIHTRVATPSSDAPTAQPLGFSSLTVAECIALAGSCQ